MGKSINLQEQFLDKLQQDHTTVAIVVVNGFQIRGVVAGFDKYTVLLEVNGQQQLVFKSAISTIKEG